MLTSPWVRLVTCAHLPRLAVDDQELLHELQRQGVPTEVAVWDDPAVDWSAAPVTVIRSVFDYHLRRQEFLEWLDHVEKQTLIQNPPEIIRWNSHKFYLRQIQAEGFPFIDTEWLTQNEPADIKEIMIRRAWPEIVVKPAVSASAHGALKVTADNVDSGQAHTDGLLSEGDALVQPYLYEFETIGETSVTWLGGEQTHCVRRPSGLHSTLEQAHVGEPLEPSAEERELARAVYASIQSTLLYARIDIINTHEYGLLLLELELLEPALYLRHSRKVVERFASGILALVPPRRGGDVPGRVDGVSGHRVAQ